MSAETDLLALAVENAELRFALAEAQEQCVELAVDAGELHATIRSFKLTWPSLRPNAAHGV